MAKILISSFLIQQWLNHYTNEVEEKLDDGTLVEAFKGLIPRKATWTSIVRILWENEEFQDPEVQKAVIEYIDSIDIPNKADWMRIIQGEGFAAAGGVGLQPEHQAPPQQEDMFETISQRTATPQRRAMGKAPKQEPEDDDDGDEESVNYSSITPYKKLEVKLPIQESSQNVLNYYSLFSKRMKELRIPEKDHMVLLVPCLNHKTAETFEAVKDSLENGEVVSLDELIRRTASLMGAGGRVRSFQELHELRQEAKEEAYVFHNRFNKVLLRYKLFNTVIEEEVPFMFISKLRNAEEIELLVGKDMSMKNILQCASTVHNRMNTTPRPATSGTQQRQSDVTCHYCHKPGHKKADCRKRIADEKSRKPASGGGRNRAAQDEEEACLDDQPEDCTLVTARVEGIPVEVLLDSCAGTSVISKEFAAQLEHKRYTNVSYGELREWNAQTQYGCKSTQTRSRRSFCYV
jgi:hypothetical protein